jgi:ubiquinone/menaquinone biosynthesis C-methylase UbiE
MDQQSVWNKIASHWKVFRNTPSPTVVKFLKGKKGRVLDLGCGSGRNFLPDENLAWFGIDFSFEMIKAAEEKSKVLGINVNLKEASGETLPYEDNFFDYVICVALLHCIETKNGREKVVKEIYRVLKSGGVALISVWGKNSPRLKNKGKECYVPWTVKQHDKTERYTYIFDADELKKMFEKSGFSVQKIWEERNLNLIVGK